MPRIRIDKKLCQKCGSCVEICPEGIIIQDGADTVPRIPRTRGCISCGHCASICPSGALSHSDFLFEKPLKDFQEAGKG